MNKTARKTMVTLLAVFTLLSAGCDRSQQAAAPPAPKPVCLLKVSTSDGIELERSIDLEQDEASMRTALNNALAPIFEGETKVAEGELGSVGLDFSAAAAQKKREYPSKAGPVTETYDLKTNVAIEGLRVIFDGEEYRVEQKDKVLHTFPKDTPLKDIRAYMVNELYDIVKKVLPTLEKTGE